MGKEVVQQLFVWPVYRIKRIKYQMIKITKEPSIKT